jgi:lipid II isoglutaminyl synthase (glutamine-hydrolysing)
MQKIAGTLVGKSVKAGLAFRRGGGHTLPGLVVEKIFPGYMRKMLQALPEGVVIITGTNGKTTTTKIVAELLEVNGKKVLTNSTGSNLTRGITASISRHAKISGKLDKDIAVLELDEATARLLVKQVRPRWVLGLNVSRDQLDRYGEVDTVASYVGAAMQEATEGVVTNARDPHLVNLTQEVVSRKKLKLSYFGASESLAKFFPSDYELAAVNRPVKSREKTPEVDVELVYFKNQTVTYKIDAKQYKTKLKLTGQHNYLNGAAALDLCLKLLPDTEPAQLISQLSKIELAFGRGEKYRLKNGAEIELVLVKNPASFTQALSSYNAKDASVMIAINDNIADGRDVSWLWDVNFSPMSGQAVYLTSGKRASDMALRLSYDDIRTGQIKPSLPKALKQLSQSPKRKVILSTYTAMLQLYSLLSKQGRKIS